MTVISKVFLQAIGLLAMSMAALISCAHLQKRQANSSSGQPCQMRIAPDYKGDDRAYESALPATNLEECMDKCLTNDTCYSTEFRGDKICLFSTHLVLKSPSPGDTVSTKECHDSGGPCPTGMSQFGGSCYAAGDNEQTWFDAKTECEMIGASLAAIDSEEENAYLKAMAQNEIQDSAWIGGANPSSTKSEGFEANAADQAKNNAGGEDCVMLLKTDGYRSNNMPCKQKQLYICELHLRKAY